MDEKDFDNIRRAGTDAARQVGEAFSQIDFSGVSKSIERAVRDVGRQLSAFGRDERSPYVISDLQDVSRARWRTWAGFALLVFLALPLVVVGLGLLVFSLVSGVVILALGAMATVAGARLVGNGTHEKNFAQTLQRVDRAVGERTSVPVAELASEAGVAVPQLVSVLDEAISRGLIPEGRLGSSGGKRMLYLTEEAWSAAQGRRPAAQVAGTTAAASGTVSSSLPGEAREVLSAATQSVEGIRGSASKIREDEVRATLESVAAKSEGICSYVMHHPEVASQFRRATTYYLPTTAKLAASYAELEGHASGPEVVKTLTEMRSSFVQMDDALSKLSDELVLDQSIDVHSDIEVLRTMLKQDGLTE
ncbi:MAG: 5-bromo-4-chloroindolyl phosphate hydrolysis family protein [Olsenella sp.]|nr:5-bromo-4-chloroindolyl phosphate hydrolysis family protein [Olsenella sp.]MCI2184249.1 5-bromo-4-chloroindolyl phosphate hydrolysis family protein [Olsenella sp.]